MAKRKDNPCAPCLLGLFNPGENPVSHGHEAWTVDWGQRYGGRGAWPEVGDEFVAVYDDGTVYEGTVVWIYRGGRDFQKYGFRVRVTKGTRRWSGDGSEHQLNVFPVDRGSGWWVNDGQHDSTPSVHISSWDKKQRKSTPRRSMRRRKQPKKNPRSVINKYLKGI